MATKANRIFEEFLSLVSAENFQINKVIDKNNEEEEDKICDVSTQTNINMRQRKDLPVIDPVETTVHESAGSPSAIPRPHRRQASSVVGKYYPGAITRHYVWKVMVPSQRPKRRRVTFMDWKKYHKLSVINGFIDDLEKDYPAICTVTVIGKSVEGRNIKMLKISNSDAENSPVWVDAGIHSREWISIAVVTYLANLIAKNFHNLPKSITSKDWHFVPVLNPDGYEYTHNHERMWRKNRAMHEGKCVGVDLNRNFSCGWGVDGDQGSSASPHSVFYRGPAPFSEPETVAVRDTIMGSTTPFKVFLSFHSYFELIIFPWGHKAEACPDYLQLLEGGAVMARAIYESSGLIYKVGSTKDMTYSACGTSTDWSYTVANIPFSYMIELRSKKHKFRLPKSQIIETGKEIWNAVGKLMEFVDQY